MSFSASLFYGYRILKMRRQKGDKSRPRMLITIISIALSLIPVIVTIVVTNGMIEGITARIIEFQSGHLQLGLDFQEEAQNIEAGIKDLSSVPDVKNVWLERQGLGLFFHEKNKLLVTVRAVPAELYSQDAGFRRFLAIKDGSFDLSKRNAVVIGEALADEYGLKIGDGIRIYTFRGDIGSGAVKGARVNRLKISGIYSIGYRELDKNVIFVGYQAGKIMLPFMNSQTTLKIKVANPYRDLGEVSASIDEKLAVHDVFGMLSSWQRINKNHYSAYESTKWLLVLIMMIIVIVAVFNIISSMTMVVLDRMQEIGILKSIGAGPGGVMLSFLFVGFCSGLAGTIIGVGAGLLIGININEIIGMVETVLNFFVNTFYNISALFGSTSEHGVIKLLNPEYYLEHIPVRIDVWEVAMVCIITIATSVLFSLYPAIVAGKTKPLEVIRKH